MASKPREVGDVVQETLDRCRRIETRLTRYMAAQGFDTQSQQATWNDGTVEVPSVAIALIDVLAVVPENWIAEVHVIHKDVRLMTFRNHHDLS